VLDQLLDRVLKEMSWHVSASGMQCVLDVNVVELAGNYAKQHPGDAFTLPGVDEFAFGMCHLKSF